MILFHRVFDLLYLNLCYLNIIRKYEEICAPQVEEFCYITDNTYFKDEVLQMEALVLSFLKFELTAPTAKCFLRFELVPLLSQLILIH
jgi:cyclin-A